MLERCKFPANWDLTSNFANKFITHIFISLHIYKSLDIENLILLLFLRFVDRKGLIIHGAHSRLWLNFLTL